MSPVSQRQLDMYDIRGEVAGFLVGMGFRRDDSGSVEARPGRFVIEKNEHGALLSVTVDMTEVRTSVTISRPVWITLPGGAERWLRELAREVGARNVQWARDGHQVRLDVPTERCAYFLRVVVAQEFGWVWQSMAAFARMEARR